MDSSEHEEAENVENEDTNEPSITDLPLVDSPSLLNTVVDTPVLHICPLTPLELRESSNDNVIDFTPPGATSTPIKPPPKKRCRVRGGSNILNFYRERQMSQIICSSVNPTDISIPSVPPWLPQVQDNTPLPQVQDNTPPPQVQDNTPPPQISTSLISNISQERIGRLNNPHLVANAGRGRGQGRPAVQPNPEDIFIWDDNRRERREFSFTGTPGVKVQPSGPTCPLSVVKSFLTDDIIKQVVEYTNAYADTKSC